MSEKRFSAETALLASQGNRSAIRRLYIQCARYGVLLGRLLCPDAEQEASRVAGDAVDKAFDGLAAAQDATAFEPMLYASVIEALQPVAGSPAQEAETQVQRAYAQQALFKLSEGDSAGFSRDVETLVLRLIAALPVDGKSALLRRELAGDQSAQTLRLAESASEALNRQAESFREIGMDVTPFLADLGETLAHLAQTQTIPAAQLRRAGEKLGVSVNPDAPSPEQEQSLRREARTARRNNRSVEKQDDRRMRILRDVLLFIAVLCATLAVILIIRRVTGKRTEPIVAPPATTTVVYAAPEVWSGETNDAFDGGSGTAQDPYRIATPNALSFLSQALDRGETAYANAHYMLMADIYLNDTADYAKWNDAAPAHVWTPIGTRQTPFAGYFDGNGFTIYGLYARADADAGLFGSCENAQILDLNLTEAYVSGGKRVGLLAGSFGASDGETASIENCEVNGVAQGNETVGGVAGLLWSTNGNAMVSYCVITGQVLCDSGSATVGLSRATGKGETYVTGCRFRLDSDVPAVVTAGEERSGVPAQEHWADVTDVEGVG